MKIIKPQKPVQSEKKFRFSYRKTCFGLSSVAIIAFCAFAGTNVLADEISVVVTDQTISKVASELSSNTPTPIAEAPVESTISATTSIPAVSEASNTSTTDVANVNLVATTNTTILAVSPLQNGMDYSSTTNKTSEIIYDETKEITATDEAGDTYVVEDHKKVVTKETVVKEVSSSFEATTIIDKDGNQVEKVKSPTNMAHDHSNPDYQKIYGPLDMEFNPPFGVNNVYRLNFGTNFRINNAVLTVNLPLDNYVYSNDATDWLIGRYYNNTNGTSSYDYPVHVQTTDKTQEEIAQLNSTQDRILYISKSAIAMVDPRTFTIDIGNLPARSAFSLQFSRNTKIFGQEERTVGATATLKGTWNFDNVILPSVETKADMLAENDLRPAGISSESIWKNATDETSTQGVKNGYEILINRETEIHRVNPDDCDTDQIITTDTVTNKFKMSAESVMDAKLPDYSNNGYLVKVANTNNHSNADSAINGPGNAEMQHWQNSNKDNTNVTAQYWRPVFATDYAIKNGIWTIKLPYEVSISDILDSTDWLTNKYYPNTVGKKNYSNYNKITKSNILDKISINGNVVNVELGDVPADTALALQITKKFAKPQDFSENPQSASFVVEGDWNFDDITLPEKSTNEFLYTECDYTPRHGSVTVNYVDTTGNVIQAPVVDETDTPTGSNYDTTDHKPTEITVDGKTYRLVALDSNSNAENGIVTNWTKNVTYIYELVKGSVTVNYVDTAGNVIQAPVVDETEIPAGSNYDTTDHKPTEITVDGKTYRLVALDPNSAPEKGSVGEGNTNVTYVYELVKGSVTVNYVDTAGNVIQAPVVDETDIPVGSNYDTTDHKPTEITVDGKTYRLVALDPNSAPEKGSVGEGNTNVTYVYELVKGSVTVNYVDTAGNVIQAPVVDETEIPVGSNYDTTDHKPTEITVDGKTYRLVALDPNSAPEKGSVSEGNTNVTYVYELVTITPVPDQKPIDPLLPKPSNDLHSKSDSNTSSNTNNQTFTNVLMEEGKSLPTTGDSPSTGLIGWLLILMSSFGILFTKKIVIKNNNINKKTNKVS
ncbi:MucBP domain-containing protein [Streptococcus dysgalactiae]|uniref:MucBP domain-containing protein n=1 Tax=Streptococcus dysgalactiae TaxID=1334 RepID=UPI003DA1959D